MLSGKTTIACCVAVAIPALAADKVEFSRDVRPIFSDRCFTCHGPDANNRSTPLRLDTEQGTQVELRGGKRAIVPGDPDASEIYQRITSSNQALRMPPAYTGHDALSEDEIETIRRWIVQGAEWKGHWAFSPPQRPAPPAVGRADWARNAVDRFVLARLEEEGLEPSPEADRATLLRRVTLDLTGLPPTLEELDAFLADQSPDAFEKVVDRLLDSTAYAERMALLWLDAARYADTNGYQNDQERYMWRWRDWVNRGVRPQHAV
jgi:hypothetical protein